MAQRTIRNRAAKNKTPQTTRKTDGYVIGVDIGGTNLRVALADGHGTSLGKWATSTKATASPQ